MSRLIRRTILVGSLFLGLAGSLTADDTLQFNRDIRPILSANCFQCHGFDSKARQAELRLDIPDGALTEHDGRVAIKPGKPDVSEVWKRISSTDKDTVMPPPDSHKELKPAEKDLLRRWIEQGAGYQKHWAFEAPVRHPEPTVKNEAWVRNPIDRFVLARLEREGLTPQSEADRATLIRRVAFTLTGLPPTPAEVAKFEADQAPDAYEKMVESYFQSPRHGEEMARHWLDVARYADTHGLHLDNEREMWAYRDWVIRAFNANQPFDQFTIDQLAGDLLPQPSLDQLIATGFNRCNVTTSEGGSIEAEFLYRYAVDRASTTVQTWLGLTGGCAVCHDHKFDPLTSKEFYSLYAFFYSSADPAMDRNVRDTNPFQSLATAEQLKELQRLKDSEAAARAKLDQFLTGLSYVDPADVSPPLPTATFEDIWFDDFFPASARITSESRNNPTWSTGPEVAAPLGWRALRQASAVNYDDKFDNPTQSLVIPEQGRISVWVKLDPFEPPDTLMLELTAGKGTRRALWGTAEKLGSGEIGKPGRLRVGDLPPRGHWTRLEVSTAQLDLPPGDTVRVVALAQYGGIVEWDGLTITGELKPADDPRASFRKWWTTRTGQDTHGVPGDLKDVLKNGPEKEATSEQKAALLKFYLREIARPTTPEWQALANDAEAALASRITFEDQIPGTFIFKDLAEPRDAFIMLRGQYDKPGEKVEPGVPAIFPPLKPADGQTRLNRLDLARWLVSPEQPATARVTVNRFWQQVFGTGLVKTSDDFGSQGEPPSHPELLDWLAIWYPEHGWDTRELLRLMVHSATFRQQATTLPEVFAHDPENRLLARGARLRLEAEQVRDNALFVSGLINLQMGGRGVKPYQPPNIWEPVGYANSNTRFFLQDHGPDLYRRSVYCFLKRTAPPPFMSNFDGPNREQFCTRRERSNTPLQALQLLNDIQHFEAARAFAYRLVREGGETPESRIRFGWRAVLSRSPDAEELQLVTQAFERARQRFAAAPDDAAQAVRVGESPVPTDIPATELAAWTIVANLLLNLDETVNRN